MLTFIVYLLCGALTGIMSGLLGLGGGIVIVPLLDLLFSWQNMDPAIGQHLALGTSMAAITFTSISSFIAHNKVGGVRWDIWRQVTPGIIIGTFCGTYVVALLNVTFLKIFFACFLTLIAIQMFLNIKPKPSRNLPTALPLSGLSVILGIICSFVGIGGGSITIPFMTWCNISMRQAVGTSAAIGMPIALSGALGYALNGHSLDLPYSIGFIYLPALTGIVIASMITAPWGVKMAHSMPVNRLKRYFCFLIIIMAARMFWTVI